MSTKSIILVLAFVVSILSNFGINTIIVHAKSEDDYPIIVSLGDSYSSGEGCEKFYEQDLSFNDKVHSKKQDWIAHRSENSWAGHLKVNGKELRTMRDEYWFFEAVSGAKTENIYKKVQYKPGPKKKDKFCFLNNPTEESYTNSLEYLYFDSVQLSTQLDKVKSLKGKVDYVTITIGGNDMGFTDIIKAAAGPEILRHNKLSELLKLGENKYDEKNGFEDAYRAIQEALGDQVTIIVVGYPKLLSHSILFTNHEAEEVNNAIITIDKRMKNTIKRLKEDEKKPLNIEYVSVINTFNTHESYTSTPFINSVSLPNKQDLKQIAISSSYSMHPNYIEGAYDTPEIDCGVEAYMVLIFLKEVNIQYIFRVHHWLICHQM